MNLDGSKTTLVGDISVNILKSNVVFHFSFKTNSMNLPIKKGCFPEERKLAEVNPPPPQEKDDLYKEYYRSVSALLDMSKVERIKYYQIYDYMKDKLSK